ncbi:MAG: methyltransferase domain-containing protein [Luteitalea sp.]|nr:methyltransferase domain-containing protein [Luteitalea sp.]
MRRRGQAGRGGRGRPARPGRRARYLFACTCVVGFLLPARTAQPALPATADLPAQPAPGVVSAAAQSRAAVRKGRLFPPTDLGLLESPDREQWQKPDLIMDALRIGEGDNVADMGAGGGWFTARLARRVWPTGLVYAQDIQPTMLEAIARMVQREGLNNVRTVLGTPTDPKLPPNLDVVLIVDAYHEMNEGPDVILTLLRNISRALKPQGRLGIVDFLPGGGGPGPSAEERIDPDAVIRTVESAGLKLQSREPVPPFQFLLVFGRASPAPRRAS